MKSIWSSGLYQTPHDVHRDHGAVFFVAKAKRIAQHGWFPLFRCTTFGSSWQSCLWLRTGHGGPTCAYLVWRDCMQCLGKIQSVGDHQWAYPPCDSLSSIWGDLAWLKTTFAEAVDFDFNCFNPENNPLLLGKWWELTIETRSKKASSWRVDIYTGILISFATGFLTHWLWVLNISPWYFYILNCLEQWFPRVAWI